MAMKSPYRPLKVTGMATGLVQSREEFILPDDAYPVLENAYVWRERIKRRQGLATLARFARNLSAQALGNLDGSGNFTGNIRSILSLEATASIKVGTLILSDGTNTYTDNGHGVLVGAPAGSGTINYSTMALTITGGAAAGALTATFTYFPGLPSMGLRSRELTAINVEQTIGFDTVYAYRFTGGNWVEFIPGTTWTGTNFNFFWSTNYWVDSSNNKLFWVTNFSGITGDPIRYTNGTTWFNFGPTDSPTTGQIDAATPSPNFLTQCLCLLPFRGRLVAFNTYEGPTLGTSINHSNRIRWAAIGNPLVTFTAPPLAPGQPQGSWIDDLALGGTGGFLDIPTSESIVSVGFVRDNLVVYCERSTWQLRYTGRSISPFQIEKVNSELGAESTFSAIQFDTSLVGIGDKGIIECDSYKSERIDIKIPDLVFEFKNENEGTERVHGIRDFQQRLAYWTYVYNPPDNDAYDGIYPNRRLVYNYENDSWAIFTDSLTCLGTFQSPVARTWAASNFPWQQANFPWLDIPAQFPSIIGANQQGYVMYLSSNLEPKVSNDPTLAIQNITGHTTTSTVITSNNHNLVNGQVISIQDIPTATPFANLNGNKFGVIIIDANNFELWVYDPDNQSFTIPQLDAPATYIGGGQIAIRDNFSIISKKFNFIDQGENIQMGFIDVLLDNTSEGAISLNVYINYNNNSPINILPQNIDPSTGQPDNFFNSIVPTSASGGLASTKNWKRVYCPVRGGFLTVQWTLSNAQLIGVEQESDVQIDAQILWFRKAGRQLPIGD